VSANNEREPYSTPWCLLKSLERTIFWYISSLFLVTVTIHERLVTFSSVNICSQIFSFFHKLNPLSGIDTFLTIDEWILKFCCCKFLSYEGFCYGNLLTYVSCCRIKTWVNRMLNLCCNIHSVVINCMNDRLSHNKAMCVCTQMSTVCMVFWYFLVELYNSTCEICATESIVQAPVITLPYIMQCICLDWRQTLSINDIKLRHHLQKYLYHFLFGFLCKSW
jgi:hypothetical protein